MAEAYSPAGQTGNLSDYVTLEQPHLWQTVPKWSAETGRLHQSPLHKSEVAYDIGLVLAALEKKPYALQVVWEKDLSRNVDEKGYLL
jgi:hypothetical protein